MRTECGAGCWDLVMGRARARGRRRGLVAGDDNPVACLTRLSTLRGSAVRVALGLCVIYSLVIILGESARDRCRVAMACP